MYQYMFEDLTDEEIQVAENNGITREHLRHRIDQYFWSIERAITEPVEKRKSFKEIWGQWRDKAVVSRDLMYQRYRKGMTAEEAATTPKGRGYTSKWTDEELAVAKENGVDGNGMSLPNQRLRLGWSREDAISPRLTSKEKSKRIDESNKRRGNVNREFKE